MTDELTRKKLIDWAGIYNNPAWFVQDPISFPRRFKEEGRPLKDIEVAAVFAAHFAWGRRAMIVRDCGRLFDEMGWKPYDYVMSGNWRNDDTSIHRTVKWSEVAAICSRLKAFYDGSDSLEKLSVEQMRTDIFGQKEDRHAANKKINMMRRWFVRNDGIVDFGLWKDSDPSKLIIPLDVHVHRQALELGLTSRRQADAATALEITEEFREIWPEDPVKGDFALFGYGVSNA